jgi:hypothetical protein
MPEIILATSATLWTRRRPDYVTSFAPGARSTALTRIALPVLALVSTQPMAQAGGPNLERKDGYYKLSEDRGGYLQSYARRFTRLSGPAW